MLKHPIILAFLATMGTWGMTAIGAAFVFFFKTINRHVMNGMLGFASGVMIAASFWSLLQPAIELAEGGSLPPWAVAAIGFLAGGAFLWLSDQLIPHAHLDSKPGESEGIPTNLRRSILLVLAITLHNIPEGLAVGVAIGAAA
ncbi:MAG: ZIP family metal transporter, partial [Sphaerochaeta sp.]